MILLKAIICICPWKIKRFFLKIFFGYSLAPSAYIGLSWIFPKKLTMDEHAYIGHFNVAIYLEHILLEKHVTIARGNWITGFPLDNISKHFAHQTERRPELIVRQHSSITKKHHLDCTNLIEIGSFVTIAGYSSQFLTHSIDIYENRQDSKPIIIGDYCFVGTNSILLGNSSLPSYSVLGANSLLNKKWEKEYILYAGVAAKPVKELSKDAKYFNRTEGFVY